MRNGETLRVNPGMLEMKSFLNSEWMSCRQVRMLCKLHGNAPSCSYMACIMNICLVSSSTTINVEYNYYTHAAL